MKDRPQAPAGSVPRVLAVGCLLLIGLTGPLPAGAREAEKPVIYVPVLPYEWLFERIGGDWIEVHAIVGEGDDCHEYSPTPRQVVALAESDLLFSGELGFEGNFFIKVGDGDNGPKHYSLLDGLELLEGSCEICAEDGERAHSHEHDELKDPHVWLSPEMLSRLAGRVAAILKDHTPPAAAAEIEANLASLETDISEIHEELGEALAPQKGQSFYVYHGAFAYFAEAYGLEQKAIETNGRRPTPKQIQSIAQQAREENVKLVFVQPQFDRSSAVSLAETIGGEVAELDPLAKDVLANLRRMAAAIRQMR
ncbi:MAG: zinc ABC transporter substrate-binding protein [Verrucomicrobiales bacterium]